MTLSNLRRLLLSAIAFVAGCHSLACLCQSAPPLTVDTVVAKLQTNLDAYDKSIPSFFVDEHIESFKHDFAARGASAANYETIAESLFRLKRTVDPATNTYSLDESRDIRIIDGKPANGRDIDAPTMLTGAFSGGLAVVSQDQKTCMSYTLGPVKPRKLIVVRFASLPDPQRAQDCILAEPGSGSVWIDPASMQIVRIKVLVPRHILTPFNKEGQKDLPTITRWNVQVIYKPVVLNSHTFWLPATITSLCSNDRTEWSFRGVYRNYHLLEVHSRIIMPDDMPKQ
jgi:hypothetical protein